MDPNEIKGWPAGHPTNTTARFVEKGASRHNEEIQRNLVFWNRKPCLRKSYRLFHQLRRIIKSVQLSAISYVATGGYAKPSLYPNAAYPVLRMLERIADRIPFLFATRLLVVMEKNENIPLSENSTPH